MSYFVTITLFITRDQVSVIWEDLGMATDPVCFAIVDEDTAQFRTTYRAREYYFCTNYCKKQFLKDPKTYTRLNTDISIGPGDASC